MVGCDHHNLGAVKPPGRGGVGQGRPECPSRDGHGGSGGVIRFVNHQAQLLFGYDRTELIGQPIELPVPVTL